MILPRILATLLCSLALLGRARADATSDRLRSEAKREAAALQQRDIDTVVALTYPKIVEMAGGREKLKATLAIGTNRMKSIGIILESVAVGEPQKPVAAGGKLFSVVPMTVVTSAPDDKIVQKSFLLAISSDAGVTWTFVEGAGLSRATIAQVVPELPAELKLPEHEAAKAEKK